MNDKEYAQAVKDAKEMFRSGKAAICASSFSDKVKKKLLIRCEEQFLKTLNQIEKCIEE